MHKNEDSVFSNSKVADVSALISKYGAELDSDDEWPYFYCSI